MLSFTEWLENRVADQLPNLNAKYDTQMDDLESQMAKILKNKRMAGRLAQDKLNPGPEIEKQQRERQGNLAQDKQLRSMFSNPRHYDLYRYLDKNTYYDDSIPVRGWGTPEQIQAAVEEINRVIFDDDRSDEEYVFEPDDMTVRFSSSDI